MFKVIAACCKSSQGDLKSALPVQLVRIFVSKHELPRGTNILADPLLPVSDPQPLHSGGSS